MFRDEKNLYIASNGYGGMHNITIPRKRKKKELIEEYKDDIWMLKTSIRRLENIIESHKNDKNFDKNDYILRINKKKEELRKKENFLKELESIKEYNHKKLKPSFKKKTNDVVKKEILEIIIEAKTRNINMLRKEDIAIRLKVREYQVEQVFMELNKEGILSQAKHRALHDTNRDPGGFDNWYGWASDIYYIK